jgi:diguanylate cyclase (GGDEF)-like protein/PAS domain S-box-containing protein
VRVIVCLTYHHALECSLPITDRDATPMTQLDDFSSMFELLPIGAYRMSPDGVVLRVNPTLVRFCGLNSEAEAIDYGNATGSGWYVDRGRRDEFKKLLFESGEIVGFNSEIFIGANRERRWISENAHIVRNAEGEIVYYEGTIADVTHEKKIERDLQLSARRFEALTAKSQSASVVCDTQGVISFASEAVRILLGTAPSALIGTNIFDSMHPDDLSAHRYEFSLVAKHENNGEESVARHLHTDGTWRYLASLAMDARDDEAVGGVIVYWRDVTETHETRLRLQQIAETDSLTGLYTRAHFERVSMSVLEAHNGRGTPIALYFIDLDNFKLANDSYGHWIGDQILIVVARRLQAMCTRSELVARLGGDEFALLSMTDSADHASGVLAQKIVDKVCEPVQLDSIRFEITASVGVAIFPQDATRFTELLRYADLAMFAAKAQSRNTYCLFDPALETRARAHAELVVDLKRALAANEFVVFYQPQVNMIDGRLTGVEALVRWQHTVRGIVDPDEFIGLAEEQGLVNRIGLSVLDQSIRQLALWRKMGAGELRLAINVSARQLRDRSLCARLRDLLEHYNVAADAVEIEVTESILIEASRAGRDLVDELRASGVRIVLDDLGVGYSSMNYLRQFPVDGVKLDRGFVKGLPENAVDAAIVRSLISLSRELNLSLVAEGVEHASQRDFLLAHGCVIGQGYLFSRPLSSDDFEAQGWLKR